MGVVDPASAFYTDSLVSLSLLRETAFTACCRGPALGPRHAGKGSALSACLLHHVAAPLPHVCAIAACTRLIADAHAVHGRVRPGIMHGSRTSPSPQLHPTLTPPPSVGSLPLTTCTCTNQCAMPCAAASCPRFATAPLPATMLLWKFTCCPFPCFTDVPKESPDKNCMQACLVCGACSGMAFVMLCAGCRGSTLQGRSQA